MLQLFREVQQRFINNNIQNITLLFWSWPLPRPRPKPLDSLLGLPLTLNLLPELALSMGKTSSSSEILRSIGFTFNVTGITFRFYSIRIIISFKFTCFRVAMTPFFKSHNVNIRGTSPALVPAQRPKPTENACQYVLYGKSISIIDLQRGSKLLYSQPEKISGIIAPTILWG